MIPVVNKLREVLTKVGGADSELELPLVAVVGSQSSGKSSVLEALVGRDFLPRGSDICTRRPLLLQLVRIDDEEAVEYGEFGHLPGRKFFDFSQIRAEIQVSAFRLRVLISSSIVALHNLLCRSQELMYVNVK